MYLRIVEVSKGMNYDVCSSKQYYILMKMGKTLDLLASRNEELKNVQCHVGNSAIEK